MKNRLLPLLVCFVLASPLYAQVHVKGYTKKDGTYVAPHERTVPNGAKNDNYSTKGNVNPYTGKAGTKPGDTATTTAKDSAPATAQPAPNATAEKPDSGASSAPAAALPPLSKITLGMTKVQVVAQLGEPNVKSDKSWFYIDRGWVRFKGETVSAIEAR